MQNRFIVRAIWTCLAALCFGAVTHAQPATVTVSTGFSSGTSTTVTALNTVATSGNVTISSGANVIFSAGQSIFLDTGFFAQEGSIFKAQLGTAGGVDTQAPSAPLNLRAIGVNPGSVVLAWDTANDNLGVTQYIVFRTTVQVSTLPGTTLLFTDRPLIPGTPYSYYVKAMDAAGNLSPASNVVNITTTPADLGDNDGDGLPNAVETTVGSNPNNRAIINNDSLNLRVDKPRP